MAQRLVTSYINTTIPGAYPNTTVKSNPVGLASSGNVVIFGESEGGESYQTAALKDNYFTPDQLDRVSQKYISGHIVDAFQAFAAPSADADIVGSANRIYVVKTNNSSKASSVVDSDYAILKDQNFGKDGNKYKYQITNTEDELAPTLSGATIVAFGAPLDGTEFQIRMNGGAVATVTLSGTAGDHATLADLILELNTLLPSGIEASAGAATNSLKLDVDADVAANRKGWGKSFELIDSVAGDLAALGLDEGLYISSQEPMVEISVVRTDIGLSETLSASAEIAMLIGYQGTTATLTINSARTLLTTTVVGGSGTNLSLNLANYTTLSELVDYINSQSGYKAECPAASRQLSPKALDAVTAIGIASSDLSVLPGRVKKGAYNFQTIMSTSRALSVEMTASSGIPSEMANSVFLSGGAKGGTSAADIVNVLKQLAGVNINMIVPLFSSDATLDIANGDTDPSSTYTIAAINALVKSHCLQYSTPALKKHRLCILSYWNDNYSEAKQMSQSLAHYRVSMTTQKASQVDAFGNTRLFAPWYTACVASGMQAGGFYKAIVNKYANIISYVDPSGYDSGSPGDTEDALAAGHLVLTKDNNGSYWVSDQTTYGYDTNFVYNSLQATYTHDLIALDLSDAFWRAFGGKSVADVDASVAKAFLAQKMDGYKRIKLIAGSDDAPLGFKNEKVQIIAPTMYVWCEIKLSTAIYFIPLDLNFSQVQSAA